MELENVEYLVVGAGFFGSVIAERIASDLHKKVVIIEKRPHVGGVCFSEVDQESGIEFHKYGTHIFHTSERRVWDYIDRFTTFNSYRHQVLVTYRGRVFQMPINLETINSFYGMGLKPFEVDDFLREEIAREGIREPKNLEEKAISLVGRPLYEAFIKGYTQKQWGKDAAELPASIITRLPFRKNYDESYYDDTWQGIPLDGYTAIFNSMLDHPNIEVHTDRDYADIRGEVPANCLVIYSGSVDRFFDYRYGRLESRTLRFEMDVMPYEDYQGTSVMNFSEESIPYTRIHEPKHLHPERRSRISKTLIIREYPESNTADEAYYPVDSPDNKKLLAKYEEKKNQLVNIVFGGRMGDFRYYDMDEVISRALDTYERKIKLWKPQR